MTTISVHVILETETGFSLRFPLSIDGLAKLSVLKWMLQAKTGIPIEYQRLRKGSVELSSAFDNHLLQDVGIGEGDTINLKMLDAQQRSAVDATEKIYQHLKSKDALIRSLEHDNRFLRAEIERLNGVITVNKKRARERERERQRVPAFPTLPSCVEEGGGGPQVAVAEGNEEDLMAMLGRTFGPPSTFETMR